jgi:CheY-like chemotaxis protein
MKVLIVDGSRAMRAMLRSIMMDLGFETLEAGHGIAGLAQLDAHEDIDLALVDWNMPQMDGLEFVKASGLSIRRNEGDDGHRRERHGQNGPCFHDGCG